VEIPEIRESQVYQEIVRMKTKYTEKQLNELEKFVDSIEEQLEQLKK